MAQLETLNFGKKFPKLLLEHNESKEQYKLVGGVKVGDSEKVALEGSEDQSKIICLFETLKKNYTVIGLWEEKQ